MNSTKNISIARFLKRSILFFVFFFLTSSLNTMGGAPDINAKVKAIFLYNFSKYIEWPTHMAQGTFKVAVYGNYPALVSELQQMALQKTRGAQRFEIVVYENFEEIKPTHMIFVAGERSGDLTRITRKLRGSNSLIVTEREGTIDQGAGINFFYENNKQKFEISLKNLAEYDLKVSDQLTLLAKVVN